MSAGTQTMRPNVMELGRFTPGAPLQSLCHQRQNATGYRPPATRRPLHQRNLALTCISRGGAADTICPNVALPMFPSTDAGPKNWL